MLKDLMKSTQQAGFVLPLLAQTALLDEKRDTMKRRRDCFHPSEITDSQFCPRAWMLGARNPLLYLNKPTTAQRQWRLDVGKVVHALVQQRLGESGKLFGTWRCTRWCLDERCMHYGFKPTCSKCPKGTPAKESWEYLEVSVDDDELGVHGHTDAILLLSAGKYVVEFKTMQSRTFALLAEPLEAHKEQALWYLDCLERGAYKAILMLQKLQDAGIDVQEAIDVLRKPFAGVIIVYMSKDDQLFKEFRIERERKLEIPSSIHIEGMSGEAPMTWLDRQKERLRVWGIMYWAGKLAYRLPECTERSCSRAKKCFASKICFEIDEQEENNDEH